MTRQWDETETVRDHCVNAVTLLTHDPSPDGVTAAIIRIERAIQLLDRDALLRAAKNDIELRQVGAL